MKPSADCNEVKHINASDKTIVLILLCRKCDRIAIVSSTAWEAVINFENEATLKAKRSLMNFEKESRTSLVS